VQAITAQAIALSNKRNDVNILRFRMDASVLLVETPGGDHDAIRRTNRQSHLNKPLGPN
jgi:hypothetical protein